MLNKVHNVAVGLNLIWPPGMQWNRRSLWGLLWGLRSNSWRWRVFATGPLAPSVAMQDVFVCSTTSHAFMKFHARWNYPLANRLTMPVCNFCADAISLCYLSQNKGNLVEQWMNCVCRSDIEGMLRNRECVAFIWLVVTLSHLSHACKRVNADSWQPEFLMQQTKFENLSKPCQV